MYSFIPGLASGPGGRRTAFLQMISGEESRFFRFPAESFHTDPEKLLVRVGDSVFSAAGADISVSQGGDRVSGRLRYSAFQPVRRSMYCPTVMGPFSYLRFLECSHDIISMGHGLAGVLNVNGKTVDFTGGAGYLEQDAGKSFPKAWVWYQSNCFSRPGDGVMLAAARVPVCRFAFPGLLCVCRVGGREYRLATYYGGRLERISRSGDIVGIAARQGKDRLEIRIRARGGQELRAPFLGDMSRCILEFPCCDSTVRLTRGGKTILEDRGTCAGFEQVGGRKEFNLRK